MSIPELNPDIQLNSFYYSKSENCLVFVAAIRNDWVYYKHPNAFDDYFQHMKIDEFSQRFERVAFLQKQNEKIEDIKEDTKLAIQHRCKTNNDFGMWTTIHSFPDSTTQREAYAFFKENYKDIPNWEFRLIRADVCVNITVLEKNNYEIWVEETK